MLKTVTNICLTALLTTKVVLSADLGEHKKPPASANSLISKVTDCPFMDVAEYQGGCVADWAIAITKVIRVNYCANNKAMAALSLSWQDLMCGCTACLASQTFPCAGGSVSSGLNYVKTTGIVGGGAAGYSATTKVDFSGFTGAPTGFGYCYDYFAKACYLSAQTTTCPQVYYNHTTACPATCPEGDMKGKKVTDLRAANLKSAFLTDYSAIKGLTDIQKAAAGTQAIIGYMTVYEDLLSFTGTGVYIHTVGQSLGMYAVVILGYGTLNGVDYWDVLAPFGKDINGGNHFKVLKGSNHCNIEELGYTVTPNTKYQKSSLSQGQDL